MNREDYPLEYMLIHKALHSPDQKEIALPSGLILRIKVSVRDGYRVVTYPISETSKVMIMQQNVNKASRYAQRARKGERISWVAPKWPDQGPWRIIDAQVESLFPELFP